MKKIRFGEQLKGLRKKAGITQVELAEILNVSKGTVAMWETGKRDTSCSMLLKIADLFGVTVEYLIRGHESINADTIGQNEFLIGFANRLRTVREMRGYELEDIQKFTGVSKSAVSYWENGRSWPRVEHLLILAEKLDVGLDFLVLGRALGKSNVPALSIEKLEAAITILNSMR